MIPPWKIFGRLGNRLFQGAYLYAQARRKEIPDIFVQSEEYFADYANEIRLLYGQGIGHIDQVAIHVRRGDYVNNPFYVDLMKTVADQLSCQNYYERAMKLFPGETFLVFSDDIEWCKNQPIFDGCEFSEGNDDVTDMNLMASCKGIIMANSSFSWWAAYLSKAKVIAPKAWYTDGIERTKLPAYWTRI